MVAEPVRFPIKELATSDQTSLPTQRKKEERFRVAYHTCEVFVGRALAKQRLFRSNKWIGRRIAVAQRPIEIS
jgi:hypothetical protein